MINLVPVVRTLPSAPLPLAIAILRAIEILGDTMDHATTDRARRNELERAFAHLAKLGASTNLAGIADPLQQFVTIIRNLMPRYGDVGTAPDVHGVRFESVSTSGVTGEWIVPEGGDASHRILYIHGGGWVGGLLVITGP
jgi:acetyl esterase/lipase